MTRYTVGFAFSEDLKRVVLIKKNHPAWQSGKLNGVGGKCRDGEGYVRCMTREFEEETGVATAAHNWKYLGELLGSDFQVTAYYIVSDYIVDHVRTTGDEEVNVYGVGFLQREQTVGNTMWLIHAALDHIQNSVFQLTGRYL